MLLKGILIFLMLFQLHREGIIVGVGKSVRSVVDQLAQRVIIIQVQLFLPFQPGCNGTHEPPGVLIIVSPQPLAADGAFQICSRVSVRFDAADSERGLAVLWYVRHIVFQQILRNAKVTFSTHSITS